MTLTQALQPFAGLYSPAFLRAVAFVLEHETAFEPGHVGDYSHVLTERDPNDPGGLTRYGIDARGHPGIDIERLTLSRVLPLYLATWLNLRANEMPPDVGMALLDTAENVGTARAVKWLQAAVGAKPDGAVGPKTLSAISAAGDMALRGLLDARQAYYQETVSPKLQRRYLRGWLNRVADLRRAVNLPDGQLA